MKSDHLGQWGFYVDNHLATVATSPAFIDLLVSPT